MPRLRRLAVQHAFVAAVGSMLLLLVVLVAGAGTGGCQSPTQVTVEIRTLGALPCASLKGVAIVVAQSPQDAADRMKLESFSAQVARGDCNADGHTVGTLVVTPSNDTGAIIVRARISDAPDATCIPPDYKGCIVARRSFSFINHASVTLPITLEASCLDVPCDDQSSCRSGVCVSSKASCSAAAGSCASPAEPVLLSDGGTAPPPPDVVVVPDAGGPDTSPGLDASPDAPEIIPDGAPGDALLDGPGASGLCPTSAGNFDCVPNPSAPVCCMNIANGFACTSSSSCPLTDRHYNCTGSAHCGGGPCCAGMPKLDASAGNDAAAGDAAGVPTFIAVCKSAGSSCGIDQDTICGSNADCPLTAPSCTKISGQVLGHTIFACQP